MKIVADENIPFVREAFAPMGQVVTAAGRAMTPELLADADALLVRSVTKVNADLLDASAVRFVATATIGTDHLDIPYLDRHDIGWASAAGCNANSVAEYIIAALLTLAARQNDRLAGKTLGVVGVGNVGSKVVRKAQALGLTVLENDPPLKRQSGDPRFVNLDTILAESDFVTLHVPLTKTGPDATYRMIDTDALARMKPTAILLNSARGPVVVGDHLLAALNSNRLAGAVLDVWEHEPAIDTALLAKVDLASPHIAGYSFDGKVIGTHMIFDACCRHFRLNHTWDPAPLMPAPDHPTLTIEPTADPERAILDTIRLIYDIEADDANLRRLADKPANEQGPYFDHLRKTYPKRREFHNTTLALAVADNALAATFNSLGFELGHAPSHT